MTKILLMLILLSPLMAEAKGGGGGGHGGGGHVSGHPAAHAEAAHPVEAAHSPSAPSVGHWWFFGGSSTPQCDKNKDKNCK